jgi:hypothetical protein
MINTTQFGTNSVLHDVGTTHCRCKRTARNLAHRGLPIIVAILGIPAAAQAEESSCSLSRAAATWTFTDSGTVIGVGPRVAFGKFTLNASGNLLNGVATSSLNGVIAVETFNGTYTVNSDCTGTISIEIFAGDTELFAVSADVLFDDRMHRLNGIFTSIVTPSGVSLPSAIAVEGRRQ